MATRLYDLTNVVRFIWTATTIVSSGFLFRARETISDKLSGSGPGQNCVVQFTPE